MDWLPLAYFLIVVAFVIGWVMGQKHEKQKSEAERLLDEFSDN